MKYISIVAAALTLALFGGACSSDDDQKSDPTTAPATSAAGTSPTAAASDETPVAVTPNGYTTTDVFPQLDYDNMIEIDVIPGDPDHATVLTQGGIVYRFNLNDPDEAPSVFLDVANRLITDPGNEEGLLGLAFPADYAQSGTFYVYYSAGPPRQNTLSRITVGNDEGDPGTEQVLLAIDDPYPNHNGGGLEFGPDGFLYLGLGDGGSAGDPQGNGQNTNVLLGKILRLDVSGDAYTSPPDNPFASGGGAPEVYAYGLRNPWRISFDAATDDLWTGDVGQNRKEEVDRIEIGGNYGWNTTEADLCFSPEEGCDRTGLIEPRATYGRDDGCSVTGGYVYRGRAMPELYGYFIYADYCSGIVWAANTTDDSDAIKIAETGLSIPGFWQDPTGELYLLTFENKVVKLVRK